MIVLALETATEACSAALLMDDTLLERFEIAPQGHSQLILPMIDELLAEAGLHLTAIDVLAFGRGPGAFTGVRIAAGVAQGIAFGADLPVLPISTLAALAMGAPGDRVLAAIDARMSEVYWGVYQRDSTGNMQALLAETVCAPDQVPLPDCISGKDPWSGVGSGWAAFETTLRQQVGITSLKIDTHLLPRAGDIARLGLADFKAGKAVPAELALPVYLRDDVAWQKSS